MNNILLERALEVLGNAYAPYSRFQVAAALLCADGSIFTGVNAENAAYGSTLCAERSAFMSAITAGKRDFVKILIIGGENGNITSFCPPCGSCRQVMCEFCEENFEIVLYDGARFESAALPQFMPRSFSL